MTTTQTTATEGRCLYLARIWKVRVISIVEA